MIKNKEALLSDAVTPVGGNPKGDVTIVEFFDYQCGYCKMVQETLAKMMAEDKKIRFIYKEFPVLGPNSTLASKAALASVKQGKYVKFHEALMGKKDHFTAEMIDQIAKDTGLNLEKLHKDMESDEVKKAIETTSALGRSIGARGTPTFVIGDKLFPGAMPIETLKQAVADARAAKK